MVATLTPDAAHAGESLATCRFAQRVAAVSNAVVVHEARLPSAELGRLREEVRALRAELRLARQLVGGDSSQGSQGQIPQLDALPGVGKAVAAEEEGRALQEGALSTLRASIDSYVEGSGREFEVEPSLAWLRAGAELRSRRHATWDEAPCSAMGGGTCELPVPWRALPSPPSLTADREPAALPACQPLRSFGSWCGRAGQGTAHPAAWPTRPRGRPETREAGAGAAAVRRPPAPPGRPGRTRPPAWRSSFQRPRGGSSRPTWERARARAVAMAEPARAATAQSTCSSS